MRNQDLFESVMSIVHGKFTPRATASIYHIPNKKILQVEITLESTQEELYTNLV